MVSSSGERRREGRCGCPAVEPEVTPVHPVRRPAKNDRTPDRVRKITAMSHAEMTTSDTREVLMAWPEQTGTHSWRVRYRRGGGTASISGFPTEHAARNHINDMDTDRRRGTWIDPADSNTTFATWVERWFPSLDLDPRTWRTTAATYAATFSPGSAALRSEPSPPSTSPPGPSTTPTTATPPTPSPAGSNSSR